MRAAVGPSGTICCGAIPTANRRWIAPRAVQLGWVLIAGLLTSHCGARDTAPALQPGNWLYGDGPALSAVLTSLGSLSGTPLARSANTLRERLAGCPEFIAHSTAGDRVGLLDDVHCAGSSELLDSIVALRGEADLGFVLELATGRQLKGRLSRSQTGAVSIAATLAAPEMSSLAALLVPGKQPVGKNALAAAETLVHVRLRPASGLNLAALISPDSQADQMFRLRSELFLGQLLKGSWEAAVYMPRVRSMTPPMALALDFSIGIAAKAAMESFVSELEATWPIHHSEYEIADYQGACFHDLRILPDLAPCYVLTEQSIVVGWNSMSLALALGTPASHAAGADAAFGANGGMVVHLDRLPEADRRLQQQLGGRKLGVSLDYIWDELRLEGTRDGDQLQLRISLETSAAS